jgi:uncharacterized protein
MRQTASRPQLLTVAQAASLLSVSEKTIRRWVDADKVPYARLPGGQIRIPQGALIASLKGNYDLSAELTALEERFADVTEDEIRAPLDDHPDTVQLPIPIDELRTMLRSHGVLGAKLFGSYARGDQRPDSDVDLLINTGAGVSLFDVITLQDELQARSGVRFELVTELRPAFVRYVEPDLIDLGL